MTENEEKLLAIALQWMRLNPGMALTGSLMLCVMNKEKRREATDIDLLTKSVRPDEVAIPDGWLMEGEASDGSSQSYFKDGVKVDILATSEDFTVINGMLCGSYEVLIGQKIHYYHFDASEESRTKHRLDLEFLGVDLCLPETDITDLF